MIQLTARCGGRAQPAPRGHSQSSVQGQIHKCVEVWPVVAAVHTCTPGESKKNPTATVGARLDTAAANMSNIKNKNFFSHLLELDLSWLLVISGLNY